MQAGAALVRWAGLIRQEEQQEQKTTRSSTEGIAFFGFYVKLKSVA
jgi:hypothetical protein